MRTDMAWGDSDDKSVKKWRRGFREGEAIGCAGEDRREVGGSYLKTVSNKEQDNC